MPKSPETRKAASIAKLQARGIPCLDSLPVIEAADAARIRSAEEIAAEIGADGIVFQNLNDLEHVVKKLNPGIRSFDSSCFNGVYQTGDIDEAYLARLSAEKSGCGGLKVYPSKMEHSISVSDTADEE